MLILSIGGAIPKWNWHSDAQAPACETLRNVNMVLKPRVRMVSESQRLRRLWPRLQRPCLTAWVELHNGDVSLAGRLIVTNDGIALDLQ
jgi:hypothetical protein